MIEERRREHSLLRSIVVEKMVFFSAHGTGKENSTKTEKDGSPAAPEALDTETRETTDSAGP